MTRVILARNWKRKGPRVPKGVAAKIAQRKSKRVRVGKAQVTSTGRKA